MGAMNKLILQFRHAGTPPTLDDICRLFGLSQSEIDSQYGVIATDPDEALYTVLVDASSGPRIRSALAARPKDSAEGLFSNARIGPFGPPES